MPRTEARAARAGCRRETCADRRPGARVAPDRCGRRTDLRSSPVSGSQEIALMVKSRRRAASSRLIDGSPVTAKPLVAAAGLRFAARQRDVDVAGLEHLKALADRFDAAQSLRAARAPGRREARTPRCRRPSTPVRAADRAPSRRRRARGRRPRGRRGRFAAPVRRQAGQIGFRPHRCTSRSVRRGASAFTTPSRRAVRNGNTSATGRAIARGDGVGDDGRILLRARGARREPGRFRHHVEELGPGRDRVDHRDVNPGVAELGAHAIRRGRPARTWSRHRRP